MIFKMYECDFGVTINGVNYDFPNVDEVTVEDPETTNLIRGANAKDEIGLEYKEGLKEPKTISAVLIGVPSEILELLRGAYNERKRVDYYCISRVDGSSSIGKNAVISQYPRQMTLNESPESMNISVAFRTFKLDEKHKS